MSFNNYGHNCFELPSVALLHVKPAFDQSVRNAKAKQQKKRKTCQNGQLLNCVNTEKLLNPLNKSLEMSDSETVSQVMAKRSGIKHQIDLVTARLSYLQHQARWSWSNGTWITTKPTTLQKDEIGQQINKLQSLYSQWENAREVPEGADQNTQAQKRKAALVVRHLTTEQFNTGEVSPNETSCPATGEPAHKKVRHFL